MHFSRVRLRRTPGSAGTLSRLLEQVADPYQAHRLVWSLFATDGDARRNFLFRAMAGASGAARAGFLTVSHRVPQDSHGLWDIETKPYEPRLAAGDRLGFSLRANPTRRRGHEDGRKGFKRDDVVMHAKKLLKDAGDALPPEAELIVGPGLAWLEGKGERQGFRIEAGACRIGGYTRHRFRTSGGRDVSFSSLDLDGVLTVTDPERFTRALFEGVGPARGFGCGLLLVRRI